MPDEQNRIDTRTAGPLGFLALFGTVQDAGLSGALLITDEQGMPVEMRRASPVRPTRLQSALYGSTLGKYVATELLVIPLLEAVHTVPELVFVDRTDGLDVSADHDHLPSLVYLGERSPESPKHATRWIELPNLDRSVAITAGIGSPPALLTQAEEILVAASAHFYPPEIFERIGVAMHVLAEHGTDGS